MQLITEQTDDRGAVIDSSGAIRAGVQSEDASGHFKVAMDLAKKIGPGQGSLVMTYFVPFAQLHADFDTSNSSLATKPYIVGGIMGGELKLTLTATQEGETKKHAGMNSRAEANVSEPPSGSVGGKFTSGRIFEGNRELTVNLEIRGGPAMTASQLSGKTIEEVNPAIEELWLKPLKSRPETWQLLCVAVANDPLKTSSARLNRPKEQAPQEQVRD